MVKQKNKRTAALVLPVMLAVVAVVFWIDINAGYTPVTVRDFIGLLRGTAAPALKLAIVEFRLPRVLMSMLVGIGLALSGCVLQGVSRNELADPGVLGINAGAGLMVALCISVWGKSLTGAPLGLPVAAFLGAAGAGAAVYILSYVKNEGIVPNRLVLTGIAMATALNAATIILLLRMRQDEYGFIAGWLSGNIWGAGWENLRIVVPVIVILAIVVFYKAKTLDVMALGPEAATGLGMAVQRQSLLLLTAAVGLCSVCVAVGGGIAFIGLVCPHLSRQLLGSGHRRLVPATALAGAILMLTADAIGRTIIRPDEVSIGIVATIIGTPYFLYLLVKRGGH